jgi:NAD(P)H-dependent FMN reductase
MQQEAVKNPIVIIGICGSLRPQSHTRKAVEIALQSAEEVGAQTHLIDLLDYDLVFCTGNDADYPEGVFDLRRDVARAHGIILGTPEYHGGISGVLKNAMDLMGFAQFEGKMLGLIGVSGGKLGAINALNSLRTIGRALHAWVLPDQVSIPEAWKHFDHQGKLKDSDVESRLKQLGRQVTRFAYLHSSEQTQEFLQEWENAPENPGGSTNRQD